MKTYIRSRVKSAASTQKRSGNDLLGLYLGGSLDDLSVCGYTSLLQSPDVAAAISPAAEIIGSTTIYLMRNTDNGDVRVKTRSAASWTSPRMRSAHGKRSWSGS